MLTDQIEKGQNTWRELHTQRRFRPQYPNEAVVGWALSTLVHGQSVLDLGCGGGRHSIFLARSGFKTHAVDFSSTGVAETLKWAEAENLSVDARVANAFDLPFEDGSMDAVVCYGVLYYLDFSQFTQAVSEIRRVLKPSGCCFVVTRTTEDSHIQGALEIAPNTYQLSDDLEGCEAEAGMVHCFLDEKGAKEMFKDFSSLMLDRVTTTVRNGAFTFDDWSIQAIR